MSSGKETEFDLFCKFQIYMENARDNVEEEISDFIDTEWNPKLEYYVECENSQVISIMVCDDVIVNDGIERESFEIFIIKPLCEKYKLVVSYIESVESDFPYIEWGLIRDKEL